MQLSHGRRGLQAVGTAAAKALTERGRVCPKSSGGRFGDRVREGGPRERATGRSCDFTPSEMRRHWL